MRFLADENQHPLVVARLRDAGYEVEWIAETMAGASDDAILARSDMGSIALLTYDRDFGELIFHRGLTAPAAIVYTRLNRARPAEIAARILSVIDAGLAVGHITTINEQGERTKPFPAGATNG